jgi:2-dehydro-3-deoxyphosphogluconate aldolase / (4S)-4-hydroxy-2-oxoglutarate aldolase
MSAEALRDGPVATAIRRHRLIVVLRRVEPRDRLIALADELADVGARIFELTFDAATAADDLVAIRDALLERPDGPFLIGAGTVTRPDQLDAARFVRADFGVAPILDAGLVASAVASGLPFVPGALTPTEIGAAWSAGATFVKLFPASVAGPELVRELHGPMPDVPLIPTGGVDGDSARSFLDAGAVAVGVGGALVRASPEARRAIVTAVAAS